jgi:hypothetical protein
VGRAAALLTVLVGLAVYYGVADRLPQLELWPEVAVLAAGVFPAMFALPGLALPLQAWRGLAPAVLTLGGLTAGFEVAGLDLAANFAKFAAVVGAGWLVVRVFESPLWVLLVAVVVVPVDVYSVARGPTKTILEEQPGVFDQLSIAFPPPGAESAAQLGLPDVLFFSLFVAAAARFALRPVATWLLCTASFGGSLALTVLVEADGVPALPLLSAAFVLANADLLLRQLFPRGGLPRPEPPTLS